jgi:hypothetical protein
VEREGGCCPAAGVEGDVMAAALGMESP